MGSMIAKIWRNNQVSTPTKKVMRIVDFEDTDPYYFVCREDGVILVEGDLMSIKLKLPEPYLYKSIAKVSRNRDNMVTEIDFT